MKFWKSHRKVPLILRSGDTALRDITDLIKKGILEKEATSGGRSTNYVIKWNS